MSETFSNNYVIQVESSHRWTTYKIISTQAGYAEMLRSVNAKIEGLESRTRSDPDFSVRPQMLWSSEATLAPGKTSFIAISFELDTDLDAYHKPPLWSGCVFEYWLIALVLLVLVLAGVGLLTALRFVF